MHPPNESKSVGGAPGKTFPTISADLPRDLALLDIERSLPKLSVLPSTGDEYVAFLTFVVMLIVLMTDGGF